MNGVRVLVDTNVFLAARAPREPGHVGSRRLLDAVDDGRLEALVSVVTLAELRAGFTVAQLPALWTPFLSHLRASHSYSIEPVDEAIALAGGEFRESTHLALPDALILATAQLRDANFVATQDLELLLNEVAGGVETTGRHSTGVSRPLPMVESELELSCGALPKLRALEDRTLDSVPISGGLVSSLPSWTFRESQTAASGLRR